MPSEFVHGILCSCTKTRQTPDSEDSQSRLQDPGLGGKLLFLRELESLEMEAFRCWSSSASCAVLTGCQNSCGLVVPDQVPESSQLSRNGVRPTARQQEDPTMMAVLSSRSCWFCEKHWLTWRSRAASILTAAQRTKPCCTRAKRERSLQHRECKRASRNIVTGTSQASSSLPAQVPHAADFRR